MTLIWHLSTIFHTKTDVNEMSPLIEKAEKTRPKIHNLLTVNEQLTTWQGTNKNKHVLKNQSINTTLFFPVRAIRRRQHSPLPSSAGNETCPIWTTTILV